MKKERFLNTVWICIEALVMLALGILTIVYAKDADYHNTIGYITGSLILLDGVLRIVLAIIEHSLTSHKTNLYRGISEITFSILILIVPGIVVYYFTLLVAIGLTVVGLTIIVTAIINSVRKSLPVGKQILMYLGGLVVLAAGVISLCYYPYKNPGTSSDSTISVMLIILGILVCMFAVAIVGYTFGKNRKSAKEIVEENASTAKRREEKRTRK